MAGQPYRRWLPSTYRLPEYRRLTDDAKHGYVFSAIGPHSMSLPGVLTVGPWALAESLDWSDHARVRAMLDALVDVGLACVDLEAPLIWLPRVHADDRPAHSKIVIGWARAFLGLPECELRDTTVRVAIESGLVRHDAQLVRAGRPEQATFLRSWRAVVNDGEGLESLTQPSPDGQSTVARKGSRESQETLSNSEAEAETEAETKAEAAGTVPGGAAVLSLPGNSAADRKARAAALVELWHTNAPSLPRIHALTVSRVKAINAALDRNGSLGQWQAFFARLESSSYCRGSKGWKADLDWALKADSWVKTFEGRYDDRAATREMKTADDVRAVVRDRGVSHVLKQAGDIDLR